MNNINKSPIQQKQNSDIKYTAIRITKNTANKLRKLQTQINKKDFGSSVPITDIINHLVDNISPELISILQENSMNEEDKFKRDYKLYCSQSGKISKNEFYKLVRQGLIFGQAQAQ